MPNIGKLLKDEIRRLARREIRAALSALKRDNAQLKRTAAALKRQVRALERDNRLLKAAEKRLREKTAKSRAASAELKKLRMTSKGVRSLRQRLGLSQAELATLVGVTPFAVYLWESKDGPLNLRESSKLALAELRRIGAREARRRLEDAASG